MFCTFSLTIPVPGVFESNLKLTGAALLISFLFRSIIYKKKIQFYSKNFLFIWIIFIVSEFISILRTNVLNIEDTHYAGAGTYTDFLIRIVIFLAFYILTINICDKKNVIKLIYNSILFGFSLNILFSILIHFGLATPILGGDISYNHVNVGRMTGLQGGASVFSLYAGLGIVLLIPLLINPKFSPTGKYERFIYRNYIFHIILLFGLIFLFTSGRTGTVTMILTLAFIFYKNKIRFLKIFPLVFFFIFILIQIVDYPMDAVMHSMKLPILNKIFYGVSLDQMTDWDSGRLERILVVIPAINDNYIFGVGYGNYDLVVGDFLGVRLSSHNTYLERIVEGGIIGLLIYIIFSVIIILGFNKLSKSFKKINQINLSLYSQGFYFATIYFSFDRLFQSDVQDKILILLFSILVALKNIELNEKKSNKYYIANDYS